MMGLMVLMGWLAVALVVRRVMRIRAWWLLRRVLGRVAVLGLAIMRCRSVCGWRMVLGCIAMVGSGNGGMMRRRDVVCWGSSATASVVMVRTRHVSTPDLAFDLSRGDS